MKSISGFIAANRRKRLYGVMFADLAYTRALRRPPDHYQRISPAGLARKIKADTQSLLLAFDVVHFPMGQFYFLGDELDGQAASIFFQDHHVKGLCRNGLISTTHDPSQRAHFSNFYADRREHFQWKFAGLPDGAVKEALTIIDTGFDFDNDLAADLAFRDLQAKLSRMERPFGQDFSRVQDSIELTLRDNQDRFSLESFLVRALNAIQDPFAKDILVGCAHQAYFVDPNHLSGEQPDRELIAFKSFERSAPSGDLLFETDHYSQFLSSPEFIRSFLLQWVPRTELAALFSTESPVLEELRHDYRWHEFVEHFHGELVPRFAEQLREAALSLTGTGVNRNGWQDATDDAADLLSSGSETVDVIAKSVKFGGLLALAYRSYFVKNMIQNWHQPVVREFIIHLRYLARRLKAAS